MERVVGDCDILESTTESVGKVTTKLTFASGLFLDLLSLNTCETLLPDCLDLHSEAI